MPSFAIAKTAPDPAVPWLALRNSDLLWEFADAEGVVVARRTAFATASAP
jgi:hypothetical protein